MGVEQRNEALELRERDGDEQGEESHPGGSGEGRDRNTDVTKRRVWWGKWRRGPRGDTNWNGNRCLVRNGCRQRGGSLSLHLIGLLSIRGDRQYCLAFSVLFTLLPLAASG